MSGGMWKELLCLLWCSMCNATFGVYSTNNMKYFVTNKETTTIIFYQALHRQLPFTLYTVMEHTKKFDTLNTCIFIHGDIQHTFKHPYRQPFWHRYNFLFLAYSTHIHTYGRCEWPNSLLPLAVCWSIASSWKVHF